MNCLDCNFHKIIEDPDPYEEINNGFKIKSDIAVVCAKEKNKNKMSDAIWNHARNDYRIITCCCKPVDIREESETPKWCPLDL